MTTFERRVAVELRAGGDQKSPRLVGHAAVFNSQSQDLGGFVEIIRPGAFTRSLASGDQDQLALCSICLSLCWAADRPGRCAYLRISAD